MCLGVLAVALTAIGAGKSSTYVVESARQIPVVDQVDALVVGGTAASVSAAAEAARSGAPVFSDWPEGADPRSVGARVIAQFLSTEPEGYEAPGFDGYKYGGGTFVAYPVTSLWVNSLEFARLVGDRQLLRRLTDAFEPFYPGGAKAEKVAKARHVDYSVFGAIPLEIAILSGDPRAVEMGLRYADDQWEPPRENDFELLPERLRKKAIPLSRQLEYFGRGYTIQTRLWIDDMYMINVLQTQAYRLAKDVKYIRRAAKEMVLYLDSLQLENGLFDHAPDAPFRWARGNGWMAAGMPMILQYLKPGDEFYDRILRDYRRMMRTLLSLQRTNGLWGQLVDDPDSWCETSGSLMFAYGFIKGCRHGWLEADVFAPAARKAYLAVVSRLDRHGNVPDVCIGTGARNSRQYYYDRRRVNGDPHGQAALLWCVNEFLELEGVRVGRDLQRQIDLAAAAGGGTVTVASGEYEEVKPLCLKNGVTLRLEKGAVIHASTNYADYAFMPGEDRGAFISAVGVTNVAIVGEGRIECSGDRMPRIRRTPGRWRGVHLQRCKGVRIEGVTLANAHSWCCYLQECEDVAVRHVRIVNHANYNNDGLDLEVRNALVEDCDIDSDDDAIVLKNRTPGFVVENVEVRRCRVGGNTNSLKIGTETAGDFRNILIHDCVVSPRQNSIVWPLSDDVPGLDKTVPSGKGGIVLASVDGGTIDGVTVRDVTMEGVETPVYVRLGRRSGGGRESGLENVLIENVKAKAVSRIACSVTGVPGNPKRRPKNIVFRNVALDVPGGKAGDCRLPETVPECADGYPGPRNFKCHPLPACGVYIRHADGVKLENVTVNRRTSDCRPDIVEEDSLVTKTDEGGRFVK